MEGLSCFGWTSGGGGGGGGTVTGANNGLHLFGTIVQMGGAFILPTTVTATNANYFEVADAYGSFLKTRDALNNFSIADFGGNAFVGTNTNIFSYLAQSNTYNNSNILYNIGSVGNYVDAIDTWNFGDFNTYDNTNITFTLGRSNTYGSTIDAYVFGNNNTLNNGTTTRVIGDNNIISASNSSILGHNNNLGGDGLFVVGFNINVDDTSLTFGSGRIFSLGSDFNITGGAFCDAIINLSFASSITATSQTRGVFMFGDSHICNDFVTYSTLIGESCNFTRVDHASSFGIFTSLTDVTYVYTFGESNFIGNSSSITNIGIGNTIDGCNNIVNVGNSNSIASITNAVVMGFGNINALANEILIAQNNLGIRVDIGGNVGIGVPYTETIKARSHIKGIDDTVFANQRLEPFDNCYEDTIGHPKVTNDDGTYAIETIPIPDDTIIMIESYVTCRKTAGAGVGTIGEGNGYVRTVKAQNIGGVVSIGVVQSSFTSESIPQFNTTFIVSGTNVILTVTGALNDDVNWNSITKKYRVS
jgi:hypothetical protein